MLLQIDIILRSLNATTYLVGGCIRDKLLQLPTKDYDIVTDANYDAMVAAFTTAGWKVKTAGKHYLVLIISKQGHTYEISNFRADTDNTGGIIGDINTDANRRDFTINALYSPIGSNTILDPTGKGLSDIKHRYLRFIGNPKTRIQEDSLRVFRFYRFLHTKNLIAHPASLRAVRRCFNEAYALISPDRVRTEIERIIKL